VKYFFIIISIVSFTNDNIISQNVGYSFGRHLQLVETVQAGEWYSFNKFIYQPFNSYFGEYPVLDNKLNIILSHSGYDGWTLFSLNELARVEEGFRGHGSSRIELLRYGIGVNYEILNLGNFLKVVPFVKLEYERPKERSEKILEVVNSPDPRDSSIFSNWLVRVETFSGTQWLPDFGVRFDLRIIWRLYAHLEYGWSFGHRPYQRLYFDNFIDDVEQPRGEWLSNGTLRVRTFGFSIRFWGPTEKLEKRIDIF